MGEEFRSCRSSGGAGRAPFTLLVAVSLVRSDGGCLVMKLAADRQAGANRERERRRRRREGLLKR
jgi:hypothetical protein